MINSRQLSTLTPTSRSRIANRKPLTVNFRLTFWPTVFTLPAMLVMLGLGTWQLDRLFEKRAMIEERTARTTAPPVDLPAPGATLSLQALADLDYRRAAATGEFQHNRELYLAARTMRGNVGYQIVTPLRLETGGVLLVNRGWVPEAQKDPAKRAEGQVAGGVTVDGILRPPGRQHWLQPDNEPAKNAWFWLDLPAMAAAAGVAPGDLMPVVLEAGPSPNPGGLPIGGQTKVNLPNDHLQYAITWYALAAALAAIYVLYHRKRTTQH
jgi:surfeit locus 1 family protein